LKSKAVSPDFSGWRQLRPGAMPRRSSDRFSGEPPAQVKQGKRLAGAKGLRNWIGIVGAAGATLAAEFFATENERGKRKWT
jgi:hypothetical protein